MNTSLIAKRTALRLRSPRRYAEALRTADANSKRIADTMATDGWPWKDTYALNFSGAFAAAYPGEETESPEFYAVKELFLTKREYARAYPKDGIDLLGQALLGVLSFAFLSLIVVLGILTITGK